MAANRLRKTLDHLRHSLAPVAGAGFSDEQLLRCFIAERDEAAFAALVRRHGPMVLGLSRRILRNIHDSEDVFQAAFLVLAQKASMVVHRHAVGGWLYTVAYRIALAARAARARRQEKEIPVKDLPHPEVPATEPRDWQPLLDLELNRLPEKYRNAVVLCELEGRSRREAAHQLGLPEGTLSSRLATARRMLARRLRRHGVLLSGGAVAAGLGETATSAPVPASLVGSTARAATLVAAGHWAAISTPAAVLTKGALKAMLLAKLKTTVATVLVIAVLGAGSLVYSAGSGSGSAQAAPPPARDNELEELRKENELLKINLRVTLEKIRSQEAELTAARKQAAADARARALGIWAREKQDREAIIRQEAVRALSDLGATRLEAFLSQDLRTRLGAERALKRLAQSTDPAQEVETALKALRSARDKAERAKALEALEKATKALKEHYK